VKGGDLLKVTLLVDKDREEAGGISTRVMNGAKEIKKGRNGIHLVEKGGYQKKRNGVKRLRVNVPPKWALMNEEGRVKRTSTNPGSVCKQGKLYAPKPKRYM